MSMFPYIIEVKLMAGAGSVISLFHRRPSIERKTSFFGFELRVKP